MRSIAVALAVVVVAASSAHADGPIVVNADLGINMPIDARPFYCFEDHPSTKRVVLNLDIAYRFVDQLAAGVHFGARRYPWEGCDTDFLGTSRYRGVDTALELGVGAQWSMSRFWAAAWFGIEDGAANEGARDLGYALAAGVDVYVDPSGHRVGLYLDLTNSEGARDADHHVSAGLAYRYW